MFHLNKLFIKWDIHLWYQSGHSLELVDLGVRLAFVVSF